jgi:hypothetical protein
MDSFRKDLATHDMQEDVGDPNIVRQVKYISLLNPVRYR